MGLRDWLARRGRCRVEPDAVWLGEAGRLAGICERARRHAREGAQVLLLAHFPRALDAVAEALGGTGAERARSESDLEGRLTEPVAGSICLGLVGQLPAETPRRSQPVGVPVSFLVAERHLLRAEDERVETLAASLPYATRVRFHLSLEDPLLARFADERIRALLEQLGMGEEDELSHPIVARAVERAQRGLARHTDTPVEAPSAEEWLRAVEPE